MGKGLSEEQLLKLIVTLNECYNSSEINSSQWAKIGEFIAYLKNELKELVWERYQEEKGLWREEGKVKAEGNPEI